MNKLVAGLKTFLEIEGLRAYSKRKDYLVIFLLSSNKGLCNNYQEGGGAEKLEGGGELHKIAAKIGGGSK